jgi:cytochrome b involved in lipid metabolism
MVVGEFRVLHGTICKCETPNFALNLSLSMPPPATSITPPDAPSTPPDSSETATEDQTTPKLSMSLPPPQLTITQNGETNPPTLMPPPGNTRPRNGASSTLAPSISTLPPKSRPRQKVILEPGHSPLDWARLKSSGTDLRVRHLSYKSNFKLTGTSYLLRIPPSELKRHRRRNDAWMAINGKVYNVTAYLPFHPGGEKEMMRGVGRDGTKLFSITLALWG